MINETEGSGSLVNVTTTSKTLSRPSSYRKSYGIETGVLVFKNILHKLFECFVIYFRIKKGLFVLNVIFKAISIKSIKLIKKINTKVV